MRLQYHLGNDVNDAHSVENGPSDSDNDNKSESSSTICQADHSDRNDAYGTALGPKRRPINLAQKMGEEEARLTVGR